MKFLRTPRRRAFTIAELIIVMMIIVLLVAILLPALSSARNRAKIVSVKAQGSAIVAACESYALAFSGQNPGYVSDVTLSASGGNWQSLNANENLVLSLMGRVDKTANCATPASVTALPAGMSVDLDAIGAGPKVGSGAVYGGFYSPKPNELFAAKNTYNGVNNAIPELVDVWGMPLLYFRDSKGGGPLAVAGPASAPFATFMRLPVAGFVVSPNLEGSGGTVVDERNNSLLSNNAAGSSGNVEASMVYLLSNPKLSTYGTLNNGDEVPLGSTIVISAGPDMIYFDKSTIGGVITSSAQVEDFDDIRSFGGS